MTEENYNYPGSKQERVDRRVHVAFFCLIVAAIAGIVFTRNHETNADRERRLLYSAIYSSPEIEARFGDVTNIHFKQRGSGRHLRDVWDRVVNGGTVTGTASFTVIGSRGGGDVDVNYRFDHDADVGKVAGVHITNQIYGPPAPNHSPEPTLTSVTSAADAPVAPDARAVH